VIEMKVKQVMICLMIALFFISACNRPNSPEVEEHTQGEAQGQFQQQRQEDGNTTNKNWARSLFGPGPANYGYIAHRSAPYDPVTESNITGKSFRSLNAPRQTDGDDQELIEATIVDMPGYSPGMVILIGGRAWVNVTVETSLTQEQQKQHTSYLKQELTKVNPRYEYEVKISESNRRTE